MAADYEIRAYGGYEQYNNSSGYSLKAFCFAEEVYLGHADYLMRSIGASYHNIYVWRREGDSNPRGLAPNTLSKRAP